MISPAYECEQMIDEMHFRTAMAIYCMKTS